MRLPYQNRTCLGVRLSSLILLVFCCTVNLLFYFLLNPTVKGRQLLLTYQSRFAIGNYRRTDTEKNVQHARNILSLPHSKSYIHSMSFPISGSSVQLNIPRLVEKNTQRIHKEETDQNKVQSNLFINNSSIEKTKKSRTEMAKDSRKELYHYNDSYIINEPSKCTDSRNLLLIVVVCSGVAKFSERMAIRKTWGSYVNNATNHSKLVFILGIQKNQTLQQQVFEESRANRDIIQKDFLDTYRNLSVKSINMLQWIHEFCSNALYVLKSDDDMYVNIPNLISVLTRQTLPKFIIGFVFIGAKPIQDPRSKWYTPIEAFKERIYPQYCSGTAYAMTSNVTFDLIQASRQVKLFWLEDIFVTGLCARKAGVRLIHNERFSYEKRNPTGCAYNSVVTGHKVKANDMYNIYSELKIPGLVC